MAFVAFIAFVALIALIEFVGLTVYSNHPLYP